MELSVILCTYNPRRDVFIRVLNSVRDALRGCSSSEVVIVDNNSEEKLWDLDYIRDFCTQTGARLIEEQQQGLTHARLRGMQETTGELLVFIDDDNIVDPDFFEQGKKISVQYPFIGAWSGRVDLEFEKTPPDWTKRYWGMLVYREFKGARWSNFSDLPDSMPCGAGLYVRRVVCQQYINMHNSGERSIILDRSGDSLLSGGDNDLAVSACDLGLGVGLFDNLHLTHYIPSSRIELQYLARLAEGISLSDSILKHYRKVPIPPQTIKSRLANLLRMAMMSAEDRRIFRSVIDGQRKARLLLSKVHKPDSHADNPHS